MHTEEQGIQPLGRSAAGQVPKGRTRKSDAQKVEAADRSNVSVVQQGEGRGSQKTT